MIISTGGGGDPFPAGGGGGWQLQCPTGFGGGKTRPSPPHPVAMPSKNHNIKPNNKFVRVTDVPYWSWMASA
jgi:hypothetical protein